MKETLKKGKIKRLLPDEKKGALSNETFIINYKNKKYVLRKCKDIDKAKEYENYLKHFEKYNILPRFLYRDKNNLVLEFIEGRDCTKEDADSVAEQVGEIAGIINSKKIKTNLDFHQKFNLALNKIRENSVISDNEFNLIKKRYNELLKKIKPLTGLDAADIVPANFRLNNGKVYLVDLGMLGDNIICRGLAKGFLKWFKTKKQRENFLKGYKKYSSINFLTKDYMDFIYLYFLITNMRFKSNINRDNGLNHKRLSRLLKGELG